MTTIRPGFWRRSTLIPLAVMAVLCVAGVVYQPSSAVMVLVSFVLICLMTWAVPLLASLEITGTTVKARQAHWRGQPDVEASRSEIRSIHYYPMRISFRGSDGSPLMEPEPHWTVRQMAAVAAELGVPLYSYSGRLGLEELSEGRLVYDPVSDRGVS